MVFELYLCVTGEIARDLPEYVEFDRSPEYWVGWALAYCQWYMNRTFRAITAVVKPSELLQWYPIYHEMDILHVVDASSPQMDEQMYTVYETLRNLEITDKPVITVLKNPSPPKSMFFTPGTLWISMPQVADIAARCPVSTMICCPG